LAAMPAAKVMTAVAANRGDLRQRAQAVAKVLQDGSKHVSLLELLNWPSEPKVGCKLLAKLIVHKLLIHLGILTAGGLRATCLVRLRNVAERKRTRQGRLTNRLPAISGLP
jgi:hypothetical protein